MNFSAQTSKSKTLGKPGTIPSNYQHHLKLWPDGELDSKWVILSEVYCTSQSQTCRIIDCNFIICNICPKSEVG